MKIWKKSSKSKTARSKVKLLINKKQTVWKNSPEYYDTYYNGKSTTNIEGLVVWEVLKSGWDVLRGSHAIVISMKFSCLGYMKKKN